MCKWLYLFYAMYGLCFRLQLQTVDQIVQHLIELGPGAKMYKVDLSRAFCR